MDANQEKWIKTKQLELKKYLTEHNPLTEKQANNVVGWVAVTVELAKGKNSDCRKETRDKLFEVIEEHERSQG